MARQIIILDLEVDLANSQGRARAVFWLTAPLNRIRPVANAKSAVPTATAFLAWQASHAYAAGTVTIPTVANGLAYTPSAGTSGTTQPTWPTTPGGTAVDGTVTWTCNAVDLNSGITAAELALIQSGQVVEIPWTSQEQTALATIQTEIQTAYAQMQTNLTSSAFTSRLFLESWNGTSWSVPL